MSATPRHRSPAAGFSLLELLVVIAIIGIVSAILVPALGSSSAGKTANAVWSLAETLEQARAYAMSKNTYVYVGLTETNAVGTGAGRGTVVLGAVASTTGARIQGTISSANAVMIQRSKNVEGITITEPESGSGQGNMANRPARDSLASLNFNTSFALPLGQSRYTFNRVLEFSPDGSVRPWIQSATTSRKALGNPIELFVVPTKGNTVMQQDSAAGANVAAIQVDTLTGAVSVFRP